jgi:hypothetical protein
MRIILMVTADQHDLWSTADRGPKVNAKEFTFKNDDIVCDWQFREGDTDKLHGHTLRHVAGSNPIRLR